VGQVSWYYIQAMTDGDQAQFSFLRKPLQSMTWEPVDRAQGWKPTHPKPRDQERRKTANHNRRHQSKPSGGETGFELAELVRCADENPVHGTDTAADRVRRVQLHQHVADVDACHVADAKEKQSRQGHNKDV